MHHELDLIVVGSGAAASAAAYRCRAAGWRVAVIDSRPLGGTCALRGCDPKKVLVGAAEVTDWARRMAPHGIAGETRIDWPALMRFKRSFTDPVPEAREAALRQAGIQPLRGRARFVDERTLRLGDDTLSARRILLANGARPAPLHFQGEAHLTHSDDFLELEALPRRVVFIGGGFISFEFAHIAACAGAEVHIVQRGPRVLRAFDPDLVDVLLEKTRALGIAVHLDASPDRIEKTPDGFVVHARRGDVALDLAADLVVHGAGRVPDIEDMDLAAGRIDREKRGVTVNEYLQSVSNPAVYAAGDAAATGPMLTPVAARESRVAGANLLEGNHERADYRAVPSVVFTTPPLARVGLTEDAARTHGLDFEPRFERTGDWYTSRRVAEAYSGYKTLVEKGSGRLLGAHLLGPHAEETINLFALAIRHGLPARELKALPPAYPTAGSDVGYMV